MKKRIIELVAVVVFIGLVAFAAYLYDVKQYKDQVQELSYETLDLKEIPDGEYMGECDVDYIYAKVCVTMEAGEIKKIDLMEHKNERGEKAEVIVKSMVDQQNVDVDAVSGATNSSKVIKKAVENALHSEKEE